MRKLVDATRFDPVDAIDIILSVVMVFVGAYSISPWIEFVPESILWAGLFHPPLIWALGVVYMAAGLTVLAGHRCRHRALKSAGLMMVFVSLLFITILRLIVFGPVPITWLFSLALALVTGVAYLHNTFRGSLA
jgi:hypothetical protein